MKVNRAILAMLVGVLLPAAAFAESPVVGQLPQAISGTFETTVVSSDGVVSGLGAGSIIYGFKVVATGSSGKCGLYDADSANDAVTTQGVFIDEGSEATSGDTLPSLWPSPYKLSTGLFVIAANANCVILHGEM